MKILGIETSCDETAAAVVEAHGNASPGNTPYVSVLSNVIASQIEIHKKYGGVIPEVAAREHVTTIIPVINEALEKAGITHPVFAPRSSGRSHPSREGNLIDAIAVTTGPGLITSLIIGVETAKTLAYAWNIPAIAVNHIEGHIYANFISANPPSASIGASKSQTPNSKQYPISNIQYPILILTVSGGHTMLVLMKGHGKFELIGETVDDAAGEAFDKAAQLLGLGYPGGPAIAKAANPKSQFPTLPTGRQVSKQYPISNIQYPNIKLPRPMMKSNDFNFSFSGLKTALLYQVKKDKDWKKRVPEYAAEFQQAVVDVLVDKTIRAAKKYEVKIVMLSGGVAANTWLRASLKQETEKIGLKFKVPDLAYCTDNAAMIAAAGYFKAKQKKYTPWQKLKADANREFIALPK